MCFSFVWYVIPLVLVGATFLLITCFEHVNNKKQKKRCSHVSFMLSDILLAQWRRPVVSSEALDLLHQTMRVIFYRRLAMAIKTASKVGVCLCCYFVCCCPGGCWGNTKWVVARWQCQVATSIALHILHRAMRFALHQRIHTAFKMGRDRGTVWCHPWFCHQP